MIPFYFDENTSGAVAEGVRRAGIDVLRVQEDGRRSDPDASLFERAVSLGRLFYTHDNDLLRIASEWQASGRTFPGVVYVHLRKLSIGQQI